jgi:hypothetical protein
LVLETNLVVCINNQDYQASLEVRKIYRIMPDNRAAEHPFIRVVDESGEDYLYPVAYFVPIEFPKALEAVWVHLSLANISVGAKHDRSQYGMITNNLSAVMLLQASKVRCTQQYLHRQGFCKGGFTNIYVYR